MKRLKLLSRILMVVGIVVMYVCLFADELGIGKTPEFGWYQQIGAFAGSIVLVIGAILGQIKTADRKQQE